MRRFGHPVKIKYEKYIPEEYLNKKVNLRKKIKLNIGGEDYYSAQDALLDLGYTYNYNKIEHNDKMYSVYALDDEMFVFRQYSHFNTSIYEIILSPIE